MYKIKILFMFKNILILNYIDLIFLNQKLNQNQSLNLNQVEYPQLRAHEKKRKNEEDEEEQLGIFSILRDDEEDCDMDGAGGG